MKKINLANSPHSDVTGLENVNKKIDLSIGVWVKDISQTCGQLIGQVKLITEFPQAFSFTFFFLFYSVNGPRFVALSSKTHRSVL